MKDNSLDGHRGKVALSDTTRNATQISSTGNNTVGSNLKCELKSPPATTGTPSTTAVSANDGNTATNFDDDYNEWDVGIGDLIIDLDADIEKTNEKNGGGNTQQGIPSSQHGHHHHHHGHHHHHHHHHSSHHNHHQNGSASSPGSGSSTGNSGVIDSPNSTSSATTFNFLGGQTSCNNNLATAMSNSKSPRIASNSGVGSNNAGTTAGTGVISASVGSNNGANSGGSGTFEHQATVDKGLKMKIKRKTVGSKYSEAKHEIVQSDTKSSNASSHPLAENVNTVNNNNSSGSASASSSPATSSDTPKSKHSSSKGRNGSHREKKEKNRDKDKSSNSRNNNASTAPAASEVNGVLGVMSPLKIASNETSISSPAPPSLCSNSSPLPSSNSSAAPSPSVPRSVTGSSVANSPVSNCAMEVSQPSLITLPIQTVSTSSSSPPMPNLTLKLENKFTPSPISQSCSVPSVVIKQEDKPGSPPLKKIKLEAPEHSEEVECPGTPDSPEMKDTSTCTTCTSVGTITEPDCLGPCEPGTSVTLEGIVWQETEGGVLVVNVTWRGKTYVGTLLDCTKHDWAPPRFCESPTSDVDSKTAKGRGKRGRGGNNSSSEINFADTRNCVQSKLRNGKGRRTTINSNASNSGFTVPNSPAKSDSGGSSGKRKGRPTEPETSSTSDNKNSKRSRNQNRSVPTPAASPVSTPAPAEPSQPSSPQWITCPEPNCSKRYKHINGLKYHKAHAHSTSDSSKIDDTATEDSKDVTNSSDNEESMQESASVSTSPAPSFANSVPSQASGEKNLLNGENASSSSSSGSGLPENDTYNLTTDLSTLASVAISDSTSGQKVISSRPSPTVVLHSNVSQDMPLVNPDGENIVSPSALPVSVANSASTPVPLADSVSGSPGAAVLSTAVSAVTTSVIQSSNSVDNNISTSQGVNMNIPTSHVIFTQGMLGTSSTTTCTYTSSSVVCNNSNSLSPSANNLSTNVTTTFATISSIASTTIANSSTPLPIVEKNKIKQERPDKYKPKSPLGTSAIRPIVPAPTPLIALSTNMPGAHPGINIGSHCVSPSLKPIQPKPTILGEPSTINPSLESLKKEKSKHKKKSKDKDKERDKKIPSLPLTPTKLGLNPNEECEALELTSYPSLEAVSGPLAGAPHPTLSPLISQSKPPETSMDMSLPDDTMNENIQSPAYSDISDANDTAPVLESEVPSGKEKEDKVGKTTPDAAQSPATNISAYGMYPYYSQPPYLLPSVSPQSAVSASQGQNVIEKNELIKKDPERVKENRPWSNPSGEIRERQHLEHHELEKKQPREEGGPNPNPLSSPAAAAAGGVPVQEYPLPQHYPYPYGYVQGYPYPVDSSSYHMHMLESDPHYKQQYKQYLDEHHRMYKEQQHHHQQQQQMQHIQQAHQQQSHHSSHHHSQHQGHHQSKSHHSIIKDERDRSRESKERSASLDKMSNNGIISEHSSKIQHSSNPLMSNKEPDVREIEMRPPSLPAQNRIDPSTPTASVATLKEKQNENHQILKENIELKSQMDDSKNKINQYEMAMIYERHKEDMRRFYMCQERVIEQQQQKMEPGIHHHTHHHQTIQSHSHLQASYSSSSLKPMKDDLPGSVPMHSKSNHYGEGTRPSVVSPAKSDHMKSLHATSSPKGNSRERDSSLSSSKEYINSGNRESSSSKKDGSKNSERSESSSRDEKKVEKVKMEPKEPEGQKPTMETTGPPPPPTNSYAYLHPSYLQPPPPHFAHMPFEPAHAAMYRGGINPMIVSTPHYANSPYMHPQIRYVTPGACDIPVHPQPPDPISSKLHPSGPAKALDLLHQVSQQYTTNHKIHELTEHAVMSPTPTSTPSSIPSTSSNSSSGKTSTEPVVTVSKVEVGGSRDASRSPPTQRHLHTHHHTHVGVGYPIYDPYGVAAQKTYT